jgi:hypothetical protein
MINNNIGNGFTGNYILSSFIDNKINNDFIQNAIGDSFQVNNIDSGFSQNDILNNFEFNKISHDFIQNIIGNNFIRNIFDYCPISVDFTASPSPTHVYLDYTCTITKNSNGLLRLTYLNASDALTVADITD